MTQPTLMDNYWYILDSLTVKQAGEMESHSPDPKARLRYLIREMDVGFKIKHVAKLILREMEKNNE